MRQVIVCRWRKAADRSSRPLRTRVRRQGLAVVCALLVAGCGNDISPSNAGGSGGTGTGAAGANAAGSSGASTADAADDSTDVCGDVGQSCCANDACQEGLGCTGLGSSQHLCFPCGHLGERCCLNLGCAEGLKCAVSLLPLLPIESPDAFCVAIPDSGRPCITSCRQPGGQFCGRIGDNCGRVLLCGECAEPGFTCGGAGDHGLCGAARDSGACRPTLCEAPNGQYCGLVGDGCGSVIDCGFCRDRVACGESGIPNTCTAPPDADLPRDPPPLPPTPPPPPNLP
jgi:hypothetical protein